MRNKYLNINVTRKDIASGGRGDCNDCPIAHAVSRRLNNAPVHVGYDDITALVRGRLRTYYCSIDIELWMDAFDAAMPVKPARFTLERRI